MNSIQRIKVTPEQKLRAMNSVTGDYEKLSEDPRAAREAYSRIQSIILTDEVEYYPDHFVDKVSQIQLGLEGISVHSEPTIDEVIQAEAEAEAAYFEANRNVTPAHKLSAIDSLLMDRYEDTETWSKDALTTAIINILYTDIVNAPEDNIVSALIEMTFDDAETKDYQQKLQTLLKDHPDKDELVEDFKDLVNEPFVYFRKLYLDVDGHAAAADLKQFISMGGDHAAAYKLIVERAS